MTSVASMLILEIIELKFEIVVQGYEGIHWMIKCGQQADHPATLLHKADWRGENPRNVEFSNEG